jgi:dolichol kinase
VAVVLAAELTENVLLMVGCYLYVLAVIFLSGKLDKFLDISSKTSRKFLHITIGNLPFIIPFFTLTIFPTLVAAPFILVTFLATPYSPFKNVNRKLKGLSEITGEGHRWGLVFYAISYTCLAFLFAQKSYVIAAGILPMAYGDAAASIVGEKFGRHKYTLVARKSFEGSLAMFLVTLASLTAGLAFFSIIYGFSFLSKIPALLSAAVVATLVEGFSPMGFDNLTVPAFSVLTFLLYGGGA